MLKKVLAVITVLSVMFSLIGAFSVSAKDETVYVSPKSGDDSGAGTLDSPYKTFERAFDGVTADNLTIVLLDSAKVTGSGTYANNKTNAKNTVVTGITPDVELDFSSVSAVVMRRRVSYDNITLKFKSSTPYYVSGHSVTFGEGVSMPNRIILYAGGFWADVSATDLTVRGGSYSHIFGGGYYSKVLGNTMLKVGGKTNAADGSGAACPCLIYGGGDRGKVTGSSNIDFSGNAVAHYIIGSGHISGDTVDGGSYINISGGKVMNVYGGAAGENAAEVTADTHIKMTGGLVEALFGGSENKGMTGNTYIYVSGGDVSRRIFGGCYNDWGLSWDSDYYVEGSTNVILSPGAKYITGTELAAGERDNMGIFAGSRRKENHKDEVSTVLYLAGCDEKLGDRSGWSGVFSPHEDYVEKSRADVFYMSGGYSVKKGGDEKGTFSSLGLAFEEAKNAGEGYGIYTSDGKAIFISGDENYDPDMTDGDKKAAEAVAALITAIGTPEFSDECNEKIKAAEKAYYALTEKGKSLVSNYGDLKAARKIYNSNLTPLDLDELVILGKNIVGTDINGAVLKNAKGEIDMTRLIDTQNTNTEFGASYNSGWEIYNTVPYNADIYLDGDESFSGIRVHHKANAWSNWNGVLNDWNVFVMFEGETEWKKLAYDSNRKVDKDGNKITNVPNGSIGATATLFGYNVSNVKAVRFQMLNNVTQGGIPASYIVVPEIALIGADSGNTTFTASTDIDDVNAVIVNINALGAASLTAEFRKKLSTLEAAYAALSERQKALVINYGKLTAARKEYDALLKAALTLNVTADSGVYSDKTGVIRFISTFNAIPDVAEIESYGTYVLNFNAFNSGTEWSESQCAVFTSEADGAPEDGESFAVDLYVPDEHLSDSVAAMSFVKIKGYDNPITTYFKSVSVLNINEKVKNLGDR